jgi:hypothetical protein
VSAWDQVRKIKAWGKVNLKFRPWAQHHGHSASHTLLQVSFFLFIIFTVYAMLPLGMRDAAAAGVISSLSHLLVLGLYLGWQPESQRALLPQVKMQVVPIVCPELAQLFSNAVSIIQDMARPSQEPSIDNTPIATSSVAATSVHHAYLCQKRAL